MKSFNLFWTRVMSGKRKFVLMILGFITPVILLVSGTAGGQSPFGRIGEMDELFVSHAAIDPDTGDLLIVSNSWRTVWPALRKYHADGAAEEGFSLERFEACCAIHPSLVAVDSEGSIFTIEYTDTIGGFYVYKHASGGEIDIDWGSEEEVTEILTPIDSNDNDGRGSIEDYEAGESSLLGNVGGGRLNFNFYDPADMLTREDGSLLVLDRAQRYVFQVSPDGRSVTEFIGAENYYPIRPRRLVSDSEGYIYLVDLFDEYDINRAGMTGVFRFDPDGTWQMGWGEVAGGINDPWREYIDFNTLTIDGNDNIIMLGGTGDMNHYEVYAFDKNTGALVSRDNVQYRMGYDENFIGMIPNPEGGFVVLDRLDYEIQVSYYTITGERELLVRITDLYYVD